MNRFISVWTVGLYRLAVVGFGERHQVGGDLLACGLHGGRDSCGVAGFARGQQPDLQAVLIPPGPEDQDAPTGGRHGEVLPEAHLPKRLTDVLPLSAGVGWGR